MIMKKFSAPFILASTLVLLASCKKDADTPTTPQPPGQALAKDLVVNLNSNYLTAAKLDSAIATWEVEGHTQQVKLEMKGNKASASLSRFTHMGTGKLTVQLFTQTKIDNIPLQWENRFDYTLNRTTALQLAAPVGINDPSWNPRLMYHSEMYEANFLALIAVRPEDTYFELKGVDPNIASRIEVVRTFFHNDTTTLVASKGWAGQRSDLDGQGNFVNRDHFQNLAEEIGGRAWNILKVRASFYRHVSPAEIYEAETEHNRP